MLWILTSRTLRYSSVDFYNYLTEAATCTEAEASALPKFCSAISEAIYKLHIIYWSIGKIHDGLVAEIRDDTLEFLLQILTVHVTDFTAVYGCGLAPLNLCPDYLTRLPMRPILSTKV